MTTDFDSNVASAGSGEKYALGVGHMVASIFLLFGLTSDSTTGTLAAGGGPTIPALATEIGSTTGALGAEGGLGPTVEAGLGPPAGEVLGPPAVENIGPLGKEELGPPAEEELGAVCSAMKADAKMLTHSITPPEHRADQALRFCLTALAT